MSQQKSFAAIAGSVKTRNDLDNRSDWVAVFQDLAHWAIHAVGSFLQGFLIRGREDILFLDNDATGFGYLVDAIKFHCPPLGPVGGSCLMT